MTPKELAKILREARDPLYVSKDWAYYSISKVEAVIAELEKME